MSTQAYLRSHHPRIQRAWFPHLVLALTLLVMVLVPNRALAKSYGMTRVDVDATINPDGTLSVVENRTFDFSGNFHYC